MSKPPEHPPIDDCNLLSFFVERGTPHPMMASSAGLWLAADPGNPKVLADYMRRCADRVEAGDWTASALPLTLADCVEPLPMPRRLSLVPSQTEDVPL